MKTTIQNIRLTFRATLILALLFTVHLSFGNNISPEGMGKKEVIAEFECLTFDFDTETTARILPSLLYVEFNNQLSSLIFIDPFRVIGMSFEQSKASTFQVFLDDEKANTKTGFIDYLETNSEVVKAWEGLYEVGSALRIDVPTLSFFSKLEDFPTHQSKLLNDLDDVGKTKFVDDFADAPNDALARLSDDLTIVDDWKVTKNLNPVTGSGSALPKKGNSKNVNLNLNGNPATPADWDNYYENEAGDILAQKGYDIEQSPNAFNRTDGLDPNKDPDFKLNSDNGLFFDGFSPRQGTSVRNVQSRAVNKLAAGQANSFVINLGQWGGNLDDLLKQFKHWPQKGIRQVIVIDANKNVLNILQ